MLTKLSPITIKFEKFKNLTNKILQRDLINEATTKTTLNLIFSLHRRQR